MWLIFNTIKSWKMIKQMMTEWYELKIWLWYFSKYTSVKHFLYSWDHPITTYHNSPSKYTHRPREWYLIISNVDLGNTLFISRYISKVSNVTVGIIRCSMLLVFWVKMRPSTCTTWNNRFSLTSYKLLLLFPTLEQDISKVCSKTACTHLCFGQPVKSWLTIYQHNITEKRTVKG